MATMVAKYAGKKMLSSQLKQYSKKDPAGPYDPYYEFRTDPRTGKTKKYKKQIPSYIPTGDADILAAVRKRAYRLDMCLFSFLGVRFGWSSVIGLVPAIGDGIDGAMALMTVRKCNKIEGGLPQNIIIQMLMWCIVDFLIGLVPFVGDLLDAGMKANSKNVRILEQHLDKKYKPKEITRREKEEAEAAKRRNQEYHAPAPATVYEDMSDDDDLPRYASRTHSPAAGVRRPEDARVRDQTRPERRPSNGGVGRPSSRREQDVEMGRTPGRTGSRHN